MVNDRGLERPPVEVVLADRHHDRALGQRDPSGLAGAAEQQLEVVARTDAELGRGDLCKRAPLLQCMKPGPHGEDEVLARVHLAADAVAAAGLDAGVAVDVLGVRPAPLREEVVLALEHRSPRVGVARPTT